MGLHVWRMHDIIGDELTVKVEAIVSWGSTIPWLVCFRVSWQLRTYVVRATA